MKPRDREALVDWEQYRKATAKATTIDLFERPEEKAARIEAHRTDFFAFAKYHFPHFTTAEFADFHRHLVKEMTARERGLLVSIIARDHAKSAVAMMLIIWLMATGQAKTLILASWSLGSAINLLTPFKVQFEANERLKHDYGPFVSTGQWEADKFTTLTGWSLRAIGSGQSPRGTRNEEARPDIILVDDFDEDEMCRNPKRVSDAFDWLMGALFASMSITGPGRFLMTGNIIAPDTVLAKVEEKADWSQRINIYDKHGKPSWWQRFSQEACAYMIDKLGYRLSQREYFNNPIVEGAVFKEDWLRWKRMPKLSSYTAIVAYLDPGFKKTKTSDTKAWVMVGLHKGEYHIIKAFVAQASITEMVGWGYQLQDYCAKNGGAMRLFMEEVFLQDMLYDDFAAEGKLRGAPLPLRGDKRKKPDKDARIEAISGHAERGHLWFNEAEKHNAHMVQLRDQFINFQPGVRTRKDGPDAVEGAIHILQQAVTAAAPIIIGQRQHNKYAI